MTDMPGFQYPDIVLQEARRAYQSGVPATHIAEGIGCHRQQVEWWARRHGWVRVKFTLSPEAQMQMIARGKITVDPVTKTEVRADARRRP